MQDRRPSAGGDTLSAGSQRVLIVEDEPIIAFALEDMLEELGYTVIATASDVDQSLRLIRESSPDAVILDVNLHGVRSYPIADALDDLGAKFIFATGYGDVEHPQRHRSALTIIKPYTLDEVKAAIEKLLV